MFETLKLVRKLAKNIDNQNLFNAAKEINNIRLFDNEIDFSCLQKEYINYLYFYNNIYMDIDMKEVNKKVLDDEIFEDAYIYYKRNRIKKDKKHLNAGIHLVNHEG
jgi:hypothetical protein